MRLRGFRRIPHQLLKTGLAPAALYGAEIYGISNVQDQKLRQAVARANRGGQGKKQQVITTIFDDVSWKGTAAPITQWAKEVWDSMARQNSPQTLPLSVLRFSWHAVVFPEAWSQVCGPIGAAALSMKRIKWEWTGPFTFTDHRGTAREFTTTSPAHISHLAREAYDTMQATVLANQLDKEGEAINMYVPRQLLMAKKSPLTELEQGVLRSFLAGSVWTKARLFEAGLVPDPSCRFCGQLDTIEHRIQAPCSDSHNAPQEIIDYIVKAPAGEAMLRTKGFSLRAKRPEVAGPRAGFVSIDPMASPLSFPWGKRLYTDGSAYRVQGAPALNTAGWSVVELGSGGSLRAAWFGLVNDSLPQSNVGGEYTGLLAASAANPEEDMEVVADYKGIVTAVANQRGACGRERLYAGTCRQAFGNRAGRITSRHVRAHQQVPEWKDNEPEIADIWGNDRADQWAKAGAALAWLSMQTYAEEAEKIVKKPAHLPHLCCPEVSEVGSPGRRQTRVGEANSDTLRSPLWAKSSAPSLEDPPGYMEVWIVPS